MTNTQHSEKLSAIELFAGLDSADLERIAGLMTEFEAQAGHVLMRGNDAGAGLLLIEEGSAVVSLRGGDVEVGPGDCVGELALLDDRGTHVARVRASTDVRGYAIDRGHFDELIESTPSVALALLRIVARRLADVLAK